MRPALLLSISLLSTGLCQAQTPAPGPAPTAPLINASDAGAKAAVEKRTERIHVEDALSSIDELRVGGETKTISVQPKGGYPSYQVQPGSGERSWKILGF